MASEGIARGKWVFAFFPVYIDLEKAPYSWKSPGILTNPGDAVTRLVTCTGCNTCTMETIHLLITLSFNCR